MAADLLDGEGDGVWFVELAALTDPALVPGAAAQVLGVKEQPGKPIQRTLVEALQSKRLLLILDNCEHLVSACASLATDLLRKCPDVHILASSREALNVAGEQAYYVPSLMLPDPKKTQTVESLSQFEAVRLFIERAQAVQPAFTITDTNAPAVAQVCWRLDGIPLALELAAARVRSLSADEINTRLDHRFRLLTGGSRTVLPRQQTLRALIDWSYDLLAEAEETLLRRLSVFAGGWTLAAAEGVCSDEDREAWEVLDLLTSLVDKSLVMYEEEGRYGFLETMRQYAGDRLAESGESGAVQDRSAAWFLRMAEEAEPHLTGPEQEAWLERLETEHDNLRAALSWSEGQGPGAEPRTEVGLRLAGSLWRFWAVRGHLSEGRQWLERMLTLDRTRAEGSVGEASAARANALNGAGYLARNQGDVESAWSLPEEALAIQRLLEDQEGIAASLNHLGNAAYMLGNYESARSLHEESLMIKRRLGDQRGIADSLNNLGNVAHMQGDYASAQALFEETLAIKRQLGDQRSMAYALNNLGDIAERRGDFTAAQALYEESLRIELRLKDMGGIMTNLGGIAGVALAQNHAARAAHLWGAADSLRVTVGYTLSSAEQKERDMKMALVSKALSNAEFSAAWNVGRAMTAEQAVEYAMAKE